ncbi:MAG: hypothetical protein MHM6MM_008166, partial [Cercozoa sp. M6MM]
RNSSMASLTSILEQGRQQNNTVTPAMAAEAHSTVETLLNEAEVMMYTASWREFQQSSYAGNATRVIAWTQIFFGLDNDLQRAAIARLLWRGRVQLSAMRSLLDVADDTLTNASTLSEHHLTASPTEIELNRL